MKAVLRGENNFSSQKPKAIPALICMSLPEFTISPKAKSWSLMNRTWVGLLGDWPPLWLRDVLPTQWSHCCNHPRSQTVDLQCERLLPAHLALANASPILRAIHRGHPACFPENITIADTCPCCGSCFQQQRKWYSMNYKDVFFLHQTSCLFVHQISWPATLWLKHAVSLAP